MILAIIFGIAVLAFIIWWVISLYNTKHKDIMSFKASLDLTGVPVVTFGIGGKKYNFLLDTGANFSVINSTILGELEYRNTSATSDVVGLDGIVSQANFVELDLEYMKHTYSEEFQVINMDATFNRIKATTGVSISGILSCTFFTKYEYVLDFKELIAYSKHGKNN